MHVIGRASVQWRHQACRALLCLCPKGLVSRILLPLPTPPPSCLQGQSKPKLERSEVVAENGSVEVDDIRTSWGAFLDIGQVSLPSWVQRCHPLPLPLPLYHPYNPFLTHTGTPLPL